MGLKVLQKSVGPVYPPDFWQLVLASPARRQTYPAVTATCLPSIMIFPNRASSNLGSVGTRQMLDRVSHKRANTVYLTAQNITCNGNANDKDTVWGCDGSGPIAGYGKLIQDLLFFNEVTYANGDDPWLQACGRVSTRRCERPC